MSAQCDRELIGGRSHTSYAGEFGFMRFFIVRPEHYGRGLGRALRHARRDRLRSRLSI
ncbi:hypothetical protein [Methylotetracoccus oryzae]|uniref:hypothetical protein n=1 Tax=Methylotetracoccus oryzae TaxID=1919059 RepID=UPI0038B39EBE